MYTVRILQVQTRNRKTNESLQWEVLPHISKLSSLGVSESYYRFELYPLKLTPGKKKKAHSEIFILHSTKGCWTLKKPRLKFVFFF